jgi:hypothetical protein
MIEEYLIVSCIGELEEFYGSTVLNGGILERTWILALSKIQTIEQLDSAIAKCFLNNPKQYGFFPSPSQILEYSGEYAIVENQIVAYPKANYKLPAIKASEEPFDEELDIRARLKAKIICYSKSGITMEVLERQTTEALQHIADVVSFSANKYEKSKVEVPVNTNADEFLRMRLKCRIQAFDLSVSEEELQDMSIKELIEAADKASKSYVASTNVFSDIFKQIDEANPVDDF